MLAGLIQAPSRFAPTASAREAQRRAGIVLDAMVDAGSLDAAAAEAARRARPCSWCRRSSSRPTATPPTSRPARRGAMLGPVGGNFVGRDHARSASADCWRSARSTASLEREGDARGAPGGAGAGTDGAVLAMVGRP